MGGRTMAKVGAYHSKKNPGVYHVCSRCTDGNNIETKYKTSGTGGGILCQTCQRLRSQRGC